MILNLLQADTLEQLAENIAAGQGTYDTAYEVYMAWREDDENYDGQGHRRNMLGDFNCIGIIWILHKYIIKFF